MVCGRPSTYPVSQITSGSDTASQMSVVKVVGCDHAETERPRARVTGPTALVGEAEPGGEDVSALFALLGLRSGGGNCLGWLRVETMMFISSRQFIKLIG